MSENRQACIFVIVARYDFYVAAHAHYDYLQPVKTRATIGSADRLQTNTGLNLFN